VTCIYGQETSVIRELYSGDLHPFIFKSMKDLSISKPSTFLSPALVRARGPNFKRNHSTDMINSSSLSNETLSQSLQLNGGEYSAIQVGGHLQSYVG
jgi:hypothetical protein